MLPRQAVVHSKQPLPGSIAMGCMRPLDGDIPVRSGYFHRYAGFFFARLAPINVTFQRVCTRGGPREGGGGSGHKRALSAGESLSPHVDLNLLHFLISQLQARLSSLLSHVEATETEPFANLSS